VASGKPALTVCLSPRAEDDLWAIWGDNLERYQDVHHADGYLDFLRTGINRLATEYGEGRPMAKYPEFKFVTLKKSRRGHGHFVIFRVSESEQIVKVLRVLHTRMDVEERLKKELDV